MDDTYDASLDASYVKPFPHLVQPREGDDTRDDINNIGNASGNGGHSGDKKHRKPSRKQSLRFMVDETPISVRPSRVRKIKRPYDEIDNIVTNHRSKRQSTHKDSVENKEVLKSQSDQELAQEDDDQEEDKAGQSGDQSKIKCHKCGKMYATKNSLSKHMRSHEEIVMMYACQLCQHKFTRPYTLRDHMDDIHSKIITIDEAKNHVVLRKVDSTNQTPKKETVKRKKITCECGVISSGTYNHNRHLEKSCQFRKKQNSSTVTRSRLSLNKSTLKQAISKRPSSRSLIKNVVTSSALKFKAEKFTKDEEPQHRYPTSEVIKARFKELSDPRSNQAEEQTEKEWQKVSYLNLNVDNEQIADQSTVNYCMDSIENESNITEAQECIKIALVTPISTENDTFSTVIVTETISEQTTISNELLQNHLVNSLMGASESIMQNFNCCELTEPSYECHFSQKTHGRNSLEDISIFTPPTVIQTESNIHSKKDIIHSSNDDYDEPKSDQEENEELIQISSGLNDEFLDNQINISYDQYNEYDGSKYDIQYEFASTIQPQAIEYVGDHLVVESELPPIQFDTPRPGSEAHFNLQKKAMDETRDEMIYYDCLAECGMDVPDSEISDLYVHSDVFSFNMQAVEMASKMCDKVEEFILDERPNGEQIQQIDNNQEQLQDRYCTSIQIESNTDETLMLSTPVVVDETAANANQMSSMKTAKSKFRIPKKSTTTNDFENIRGNLADFGNLESVKLPIYRIPSLILQSEKNGETELFLSVDKCRQNKRKYIDTLKTMIFFEEAVQAVEFTQYNHYAEFEYSGYGRVFKMNAGFKAVNKIVKGFKERLLKNFILKPIDETVDFQIDGEIIGYDNNISVKINENGFDYVRNNCQKGCVYATEFYYNQHIYQLQHNALKFMEEHELFHILINNPKYDNANNGGIEQFDILNDYTFSGTLSMGLNEEQKAAVINIVESKNFPLPYLLFGPPGTGKTHTLVCAIEEIIRSSPTNCVLVCANSNTASDEIAERLTKVMKPNEMFRMYAKSFDSRKITDKIKPYSNWSNGVYYFPSLKNLYKFRVIVCTMAVAGQLTMARTDRNFKSNHFSHVILDECANTHETVSLIPIAGLCTSKNRVESSIVFVGDPKQLSAVTKSHCASKLGFQMSLMERLFEKPLYKRHSATEQYNQKFITQLVNNYRSHPSILHIPNVLFYDSKLKAKASPEITNWYIKSDLLPNKDFPVIFHSVCDGVCARHTSGSMYNMKEVTVVMSYIKDLLQRPLANGKLISQNDIGVTSPYKAQCDYIVRNCQRQFGNIVIGTADMFQGHEKPIMIASTVRTNQEISDFVTSPQRFNVVITRAKCLLIVVGDPKTLCLDETWKTFLNYCEQNHAILS